MLPDDGQAPVSTSPILTGTILLLEFPDSDRTARWDDDGLEVLYLGNSGKIFRCY